MLNEFRSLLTSLLAFSICTSLVGCAFQSGPSATNKTDALIIKDGMAQPMLTWSDYRAEQYTNEGSDILRFCVYVETDHDTDNDGKADLVKAFVQVPRAAAEGSYKAGVILNSNPYDASYIESTVTRDLYEQTPFDYKALYKEGEKRAPVSSASTKDAATKADPADWNYTIPRTETQAYEGVSAYDYFLVRGFAIVTSCGIGTYGSEGFELCGMDLERDSYKCVVEWLAHNRVAYTDRTSNVQIAADWSNGNVAMTGMSYGGTMPFEVATTGVEGLRTIIPVAGIANWYDYTNSQGIPIRDDVNYTDMLASSNCGGVYTDEAWTKLKSGYGSYLWQIAQDESTTNGDYAEIWDMMNYSDDYANIKCSAFVVQGLNDFNVDTRQADMMEQAFSNAKQTKKLILHQGDHRDLTGMDVNGTRWEDLLNKWLCHYLYDEDNGIENMADVTAQSNIDGSWKTYDTWRDFSYKDIPAHNTNNEGTSSISSESIAEYAAEALSEKEDPSRANFDQMYYTSLDGNKAAQYVLDVPSGTTLFGAPEVRAKLSTKDVDKDGLMITAVLVDELESGDTFNAYVSSKPLCDSLPTEVLGTYEIGGGAPEGSASAFSQLPTWAKVVSYGWTDLQNPGCGIDPKEYVFQEDDLKADTYYDYTFHMVPTAYTLAPGHKLKLVLTTWDPYRAFLDEDYKVDTSRDARYSFYTYGYTVDNSALEVRLPVR